MRETTAPRYAESWLWRRIPMRRPGALRCGFPRTFGCRLGVGHPGKRTRWCGGGWGVP